MSAFLMGAAITHPALAETRALVVGVSGYPNLPETIRLSGPKNDARAVANALAGLGVAPADITVLADGATGLADGIGNGGPATHKAVLDKLDGLAATAEPGDLVVFYFSGHGSRQPDENGDEEGGMDEIFLPYDISSWNGAGAQGALVDDELGERVQKILDKGADFFGVIDACHSATGFRAIEGDMTRTRGVDPEVLGIPASNETSRSVSPGRPVRQLGREADGDRPGRGRAAFFYAAQESEEALETVPKGAAPGESYGVFTFNLLRRLSENPGLSYRRLHQAVVADIKRNTLMSTQTPELEGTLVDEPALRLGAAASARQWPIYNGALQAGMLQGLSNGAVLGLFDDPAAPDAKALTRGVVEAAGAAQSNVVPGAQACAGAADCGPAPDPAVWKKARWARLLEPGIDFTLTLSEPVRVDPKDGFDYAPALAALKSALGSAGVRERITTKADGFDMAVALVDGKLAFAPAAGLLDAEGPGSSPRLTLPSGARAASAAVAAALDRMARALALQKMGDSVAGEKLGLQASIQVRRVRGGPVDGACPADEGDAYAAPVAVGTDEPFYDCDILSIAMGNAGRKPLDVTALMIGHDFSISPVWPSAGNANRIDPGDTRDADVLQMEPNPASGSAERLVFLAVPGVNRSHVVFDSFEQEGVRAVPSDEAPETARARAMVAAASVGSTERSAARPAGLDEEMAVAVSPFRIVAGRNAAGQNAAGKR